MTAVPKKIVVDEQGKPLEVILSWSVFEEIAETLGWDLDEDAKRDLRETKKDLDAGREDAFTSLSSL